MKVYESTSSAHNLEVSLQFMGANSGVVTGSATIVSIKRNDVVRNILVDRGCFQGKDESKNYDRNIDASKIHAFLITHAHLDHGGDAARFYKIIAGKTPYKGKIYGSVETLNQLIPLLTDAAKQYELKYRRLNRSLSKTNSSIQKWKEKAEREDANPQEIASYDSAMDTINEQLEKIPFTMEDVEETIKHFERVEIEEGGTEISLFEGIDIKFIPSPHINGSTMVEISASLGDQNYTILFTGDIGRNDSLLYKNLSYKGNPLVKSIVLESLHGTEESTVSVESSVKELYQLFEKIHRNGQIGFLVSFAMDRSAMMVKLMNDFKRERNPDFKYCIDSPLTERELILYQQSYLNGSVWFKREKNRNPFNSDDIKFINGGPQHVLAAMMYEPDIVLTASGWGYGGRVLDYFRNFVQDPRAVFIFPEFMEEGCPSRILVDAKKGELIELNGERLIKQCETHHLSGFSSHGYLPEKLQILGACSNLDTVFLNHGDEVSLNQLYDELSNMTKPDGTKLYEVIIPEYGDCYKLR